MRPGYFISETNQRMSIKFGTGDQQKRPQMYLLIFVSIGPTTALDEDIMFLQNMNIYWYAVSRPNTT